ncbi:uncharacterized protein LOC134259947 [Saccostrea cucullata]|uniref:uncharacterized protein LOC134259947 n=1 Tax=Saccostrea cuccullata TaxID=36930 RepID=UPI002ED40428
MVNIAETEAFFDLVLRDQFLHVYNRDLTLFLKERIPKSIQDMANLADQYREARLANAVTFTGDKSNDYRPKKKDRHDHDSHRNGKGERKYQAKPSFIPKSERRCYVCHKQKQAKVLRDTECTGIVVRKSKVDEDKFIRNKFQTCILADGSSVKVSVATISIDTPYITGTFDGWCMDNPIYDLIIGKFDKVRSPDDPDPLWTEVHAVETRQQVKKKQKPCPQLHVPEILKDTIRPEDIKIAQERDETLGKIRQWAAADQEVLKRRGKISWFLKSGLIYRKYQSTDENGKIFIQLVEPQKFREVVMNLAHQFIISRHLATCCTTSRILTEFCWPGIQSKIKRFCRSCDICQRTVHKGRVTRYPLQKMPLIDEVFKGVAVDISGPIHPVTDKGNRYVLTLVDFASRYPEAIPLATIETERVAEGLLEIFSRMGIPDEILSDMGSQFTSAFMRELVFGRHVKGPVSILKELSTRDVDDPQVRTTYEYVLDLRECLESTAALAREIPEKASKKQTKYYNKSARTRLLKVNDKVLVLLPTDSNQLLQQRKGPFSIKKKVNKVDYQISMGELSDDDRRKFISLLNQFSDVLSEVPGNTHLIEHDIKTNSDQPIRSKSYSVPFAMRDTVDKEVEKMLELKVIEPSDSPYCSPNTRFVQRLLASSTHCILKAKDSLSNIQRFASVPSYAVWISNSSSDILKTYAKLLYGMQNIDNFIDDVIIFTPDFDQHLKIREELFSKLRDANLTAKPSKCSIGYSSLECLGHIVGEDRLKPHPEKVRAIQDESRPETERQLKSFLGLTDASEGDIGAVLLQLDDDIGLKLPVAYASSKLKPSEYHQPLMYLNKTEVINSRVMRWALSLQFYRDCNQRDR